MPWTDLFVDIEGAARARPRFRTRVKMLWDSEFFYVGAELEEPHVWGTLTQHDSVIFHDNDFEVFIDPNGDNHEYYEFEINALNTGWDLLLPRPYKDGGAAVVSWEIPGLKTAVHVDGTLNDPRDMDNGWTVEIAFPWKVLGELAHKPVPPPDERTLRAIKRRGYDLKNFGIVPIGWEKPEDQKITDLKAENELLRAQHAELRARMESLEGKGEQVLAGKRSKKGEKEE